MKKISLLMILILFGAVASGGYGYYTLVLNDEDEDSDDNNSSLNSKPIAKINPTNPRIQVNDTVLFTASDSSDEDNDELSYVWMFEGDNKEYEGRDIERTYTERGNFEVKLMVTDSTGLSDEVTTTVTVISNYHGEFDGSLEASESDTISFPVELGAITLEIGWNLTDENEFDPFNPQQEESSVDIYLEDSEGNILENATDQGEGSGSWSISDERLEPSGTYTVVIECTSGAMGYEIVVDVEY